MDIQTFINTVRQMRKHQTDYFTKGRKQSDLIESKRLEKLVDRALVDGIAVPMSGDCPDDAEPGQQFGMFE
jgi:hypothetical protein